MKKLLIFLFIIISSLNLLAQEKTYGGTQQSETLDSLRNRLTAMENMLLTFPFGLGGGNGADTAVVQVGTYMGGLYVAGDTIVADTLHLECEGASGDVTVRMFYGTNPTSGTGMHTAEQITTTGGQETISSFSPTDIPPGNRIWMEVTAVGTTKPTLILCDLIYHRK